MTGATREVDAAAPRQGLPESPVTRVGGYFVVVPPGAAYGEDLIGNAIMSLVRSWWMLLLGAVVGGALALALSSVMTPVYRAEVTLVAADDESPEGLPSIKGIGSLASLAGLGGDAGAKVQESLAVLRSFEFTAAFITSRNLLPVLYPDDYAPDGKPRSSDARTLQDAVEQFQRKVSRLVVDEDQGVFRLRVYWSDATVAADWANGRSGN
jgi:hypothetical protein